MAKLLALSILMPFFINASLTSTNHVRVAILAILIIIVWRIILRRARAYIRLLETDALKFLHNDDGLMVGNFFPCIHDVSALILMITSKLSSYPPYQTKILMFSWIALMKNCSKP